MLDMLHLLVVACLFAGAWLISRGAAYVARATFVQRRRERMDASKLKTGRIFITEGE